MRITHGMLSDSTLRNLNTTMERLNQLQDELTSGQRINAPSDDPIGAAAAVEFRGTLQQVNQYLKNVDAANSWMGASDSALDAITQVLDRARSLAVQGANDTLSSSDKQSIATEVSQLLDQAIASGNSTYTDQYLFAGFKVGTKPFTLVSGASGDTVRYDGDSGQIQRQVDSQSQVTVNVPGGAGTAFDKVFSTLISLRGDLTSGTSADVSARIADLDSALNSVLAARSQIGARMNRLDLQKNTLQSLQVNVSGLLSKTQDVDMAQAITEFSVQQNVYQAALAAGAKAIQPSLLDYLR